VAKSTTTAQGGIHKVNRRSFFKWATAVGAALVLPSSVRPSKGWALAPKPVVFGDWGTWELNVYNNPISGDPVDVPPTYLPGLSHWDATAKVDTHKTWPRTFDAEFKARDITYFGRVHVAALDKYSGVLHLTGTGPLVVA